MENDNLRLRFDQKSSRTSGKTDIRKQRSKKERKHIDIGEGYDNLGSPLPRRFSYLQSFIMEVCVKREIVYFVLSFLNKK